MKTKRLAVCTAILVGLALGAYLFDVHLVSPQVTTEKTPITIAQSATIAPVIVSSATTISTNMFALGTTQTASVRGTKPYILKSDVPFQKSLRLVAEGLGARAIGLIAPNSLLVEVDDTTCAQLRADARFSGLEEVLPKAKVSQRLIELIKNGAQEVQVAIRTLSNEDRPLVINRVNSLGGEILSGTLNERDNFRAKLSPMAVATLAACGDVRRMDCFERPHLMNDLAVNPKAMNVRPVWELHGLSGLGQIVTTSDSGIDVNHPDFEGQIVGIGFAAPDVDETDVNGHGTHTAGSIAGTGAKSDGKIRGTAYGAKLWAWFCGGPENLIYTPESAEDLFQPDQEHYPAYIHSASWGTNTKGLYTDECESYDTFVWEHSDFLPVFSAGNAGSYSRTIGSPASAKNVLAVGATQNLRQDWKDDDDPVKPQDAESDGKWYSPDGDPARVAAFSSRGPCADGRIKPDIAAPGAGILSTRSHGVAYMYGTLNEWYAYDSGTSMSCPLVAGSVALIREWLISQDDFDETPEKRPTAALMKAIITGGAKSALKPENGKGWGCVDLEETLFPSNRAVKLVDRIPFAEGKEFYYVVETTNAAPLDVQLVWVDYPGEGFDSAQTPVLVNDLDLTVQEYAANAHVNYGNGGAVDDMFDSGETAVDTLNNIESVRIQEAQTNRYLITVKCSRILHDYTEGGAAALYIRGAFDPNAEPDREGLVRIRERPEKPYLMLGQAIEEAQDGETIEILHPVALEKSIVIENKKLTILATNEVPHLSAVNAAKGASITLGEGAEVFLENIVMTNAVAGSDICSVEKGARLKVAGIVDVGVLTLAENSGLTLAGTLNSKILIMTEFPTDLGDAFGLYQSGSEASATNLVNAFDLELGGFVRNGRLVWEPLAVSDDEAVVSLEDAVTGSHNYRSLRMLFKVMTNDAVVVLKDNAVLSSPVTLVSNIRLTSEAGSNSITSCYPGAQFVIPTNTSLCVSNVTIQGGAKASEKAFFDIQGGRLVLEKQAIIKNLLVNSPLISGSRSESPILLQNGVFEMNPDSQIANCQAQAGEGGAIKGLNGEIKLNGGTILGCHALKAGGAIYSYYAPISVKGNLIISGNHVGTKKTRNDIYLYDQSRYPLHVVGALGDSAKIGVAYSGAEKGLHSFAVLDADNMTSAETNRTAAAFLNTANQNYIAAVSDSDATKIVWTQAPPAGMCDESEAQVCVIDEAGQATYWQNIENAFDSIRGGVNTIEIMKNPVIMNSGLSKQWMVLGDLTIRSRGEGANEISNFGGDWFCVPAGSSLILTNVVINGKYQSDNRLIGVEGGELVLEANTTIKNYAGFTLRDSSAISVYRGGRFVMKKGATLAKNRNTVAPTISAPSRANAGMGGAVLLDGASTGYFEGGVITNCYAFFGGGVAVCNESVAYVSGDFRVFDNSTKSSYADQNNFDVEDLSKLYLAAPLTEDAMIGRTTGFRADTNLVAYVENWREQWDAQSLTNDARRFVMDLDPHVHGFPVTNETADAIIVWSTSIAPDGSFEAADGMRYFAAGEVPPPDVDPVKPTPLAWSVVTNNPTPIAFKSIDRLDDTEWALVITNREPYCNYRLIWTDNLTRGFTSTGAWEKASGAVDPVWTTNVITSGGAWFWRAEGMEGTNMVPPQVEN